MTSVQTAGRAGNATKAQAANWPDRRLPVLHYLTAVAPPTDYLCGSLALVAGTVGDVIAQGDTGKTGAMLEMSLSIAAAGSEPVYDPLGVRPGPGRVVYYCAEDPDEQLHKRLRAITRDLTPDQLQVVEQHFELRSVCGAARSLDLCDHVDQDHIIATCTGARLIVFDTLARFHHADENSNPEMIPVIAGAERIAQATGAAVIFVHHLGKGAAADGGVSGALAARGASVIVENARWVLHMRRDPDRGDVEVREVKHNYGRGADLFRCRWERGVLTRYEPSARVTDISASRRASRTKAVSHGIV